MKEHEQINEVPPSQILPTQCAAEANKQFEESRGPATVPLDEINIDGAFAALMSNSSDEELKQLEENLRSTMTCRDPLVLWKGTRILLDGHQRFALCCAHGFSYQTVEIELPDRNAAIDWIINNQLGRRNLTPEQMSYLRGKRYVAMRQTHGGDRRSDGASVNGESLKIAEPSASDGSSAQFEHLKTDEVLASEYRVSPVTIRRDGQFAEDVDAIAENCGVEAKKAVLAGEANLTRTEIHEVAELPPDEQQGAMKGAVEEPAKRPRKGSKSGETRITLPSEPKALVAALVQRLDRERLTQVHKELGEALKNPVAENQRKGRKKKAVED